MAQKVGVEIKTTTARSNCNNLSSDISWQAPGRKDFIICTVDKVGKKSKQTKQLHYMFM